MYDFFSLLSVAAKQIVVGGDAAAADTTQAAIEAAGEVAQAPSMSLFGGAGIGGILPVLGYFIILGGAMWFFMIRPQRKREKALREMQESLRPGDNVVTTSGLYGKIVDSGEDVFIVEFGTNRGIRVPVAKSDVASVKEPKLTKTKFDDTETK